MHQGVILGEFVVATAQLLDHNFQFVRASGQGQLRQADVDAFSCINGLVEDILEAGSSVQHVAQLEAVGGQDTLVQHLNGRACRRLARGFPGGVDGLDDQILIHDRHRAQALGQRFAFAFQAGPHAVPLSRREHVPARLACVVHVVLDQGIVACWFVAEAIQRGGGGVAHLVPVQRAVRFILAAEGVFERVQQAQVVPHFVRRGAVDVPGLQVAHCAKRVKPLDDPVQNGVERAEGVCVPVDAVAAIDFVHNVEVDVVVTVPSNRGFDVQFGGAWLG